MVPVIHWSVMDPYMQRRNGLVGGNNLSLGDAGNNIISGQQKKKAKE